MRKDAPAIITWLVNTCWFAFKWSIVAMLATVVLVGGYLYLRLDDELRRYAETVLASHYSELDVKVGSARFVAGRGVMLRNVVISQRGAGDQLHRLTEVDEVQMLGAFDLEALTSGRPVVERIRLRSPRVYANRHANGQWNIQQLFPPPATSSHPATVEVVGAIVTIADASGGATKPITLRDVGLTAECTDQTPAATPGAALIRTYHVEASLDDELADTCTLAGDLQTGTGVFDATAHLTGIDLSSALIKTLVRRSPQLAKVAEISGKLDLTLHANRKPGAAPTWNASFAVTGGRIGIDGVPRPISHIVAQGTASNQRLLIRRAEARFGKATLALALDRNGWSPNAPLALRAQANQFMLDESLAEILPPDALKVWKRFRPAGQINATLAAQYDGQWKPNLTVECQGVSFIDREKFDYRLTGGTGTLKVSDHGDGRGPVLDIVQLTASVGGTPTTINGSFAGLPGLGARRTSAGEVLPATGWMEVSGNNFRISDRLVDAIGPKVRRIVDSLDAKGRFSLQWRFERPDPLAEPSTSTQITFHNSRVEFEKFRYPLTHINGTAIEQNDNWRFENLVSRDPNASREVRASGTCTKLAGGGHQLQLTFVGEHVPLDDTLRLALSPAHQATWAAVRPQSGRVNFVASVSHRLGIDTRPDVHLEIKPLPQVVSIEPSCFQYRLENLQGTIVVDNNQVTLKRIRAEHGPTVFETDGNWIPNERGGWALQFNNLHVDRLAADYDLKRAAPPAVGKVIDHLKPVGVFSIYDGTVRFSHDTAGSTHLRSDWKISLGCQQNDLELGVPLKSVTGAVHLAGRHEGNLRFTAGQLDLDSVFWNGMQFTNVRGPLWVDSQECRLGQEASRRINANSGKQAELKRIEANLYGGLLQLDSDVKLSTGSRYVVDLAIEKCDLARMSTDYFGGSVDLSGSLSGQATLNGIGRSVELLDGGGRVAIRNAQMYELPVMARLLKVLRNRVPDKTAFNGVDALFKIDGKSIAFDEINLLGDAVSMYGKGTATFDRQLDLKFHTTVGRNDFNVPLLRSMIGQASANLMLIEVTGPVDNAVVERKPLPAVNDFVEQLQGEGVASPRPMKGFWNR